MQFYNMLSKLSYSCISLLCLIACSSAATKAAPPSQPCVSGQPIKCECGIKTGEQSCVKGVLTECVCKDTQAKTPPASSGAGTGVTGDVSSEELVSTKDGPAATKDGPKPSNVDNDNCENVIKTDPITLSLNQTRTYLSNATGSYRHDVSPSCATAPGPDGVLFFEVQAKGKLQASFTETPTEATDPGLGEAVLSLRRGYDCASAKEDSCRVMSGLANPYLSLQVEAGDRIFVHWGFTDANAPGKSVVKVQLLP
jgi:hypothetical protein